jgi:predicted transcriptional regulator
MLIKDEMKRDVFVTGPGDSVKNAINLMSSKNIGCVVSVDKNKPVGILTERDILRKVVAPGIDSDNTKVRDVMTKKLISMESSKTVQEAVDLLEKRGIKRLPVIEFGKLIGIVTMTDLLKCLRKIENENSKKLRKTIKELHLTKIKLQSRIIRLEDKLTKR